MDRIRSHIVRILCLSAFAALVAGFCLARPLSLHPRQARGEARPATSGSSRSQALPRSVGDVVIPSDERYAYLSERFRQLVAESYAIAGGGKPDGFYTYMDKACRSSPHGLADKDNLALPELLRSRRAQLSHISDAAKRTRSEIAACEWLHHLVKSAIPRFSLDRGFEFHNVVRFGERQCFLQSVLIAGLLQETGVDAGVVIVYRNERGEESNNGHAVALVKLSDGTDVIVDASDPDPFAPHRGLFVRTSDYAYAVPAYEAGSSRIAVYVLPSNGRRLAPAQVRTLDFAFLRSQFYYYRGEREPGGIMSSGRRASGLRESERCLRTSVELCPANPLATYMLGRVYLAEGKVGQARTALQTTYRLYERFGWVPEGPRQYLAQANGRHPS